MMRFAENKIPVRNRVIYSLSESYFREDSGARKENTAVSTAEVQFVRTSQA